MKLKKTACLLLSAVLFLATLTPICAFANADLADKDAEENMAWLSDFYIRESAMDFVKNEVTPENGVYSDTAETFVKNVENLKKAYNADFNTFADAYDKILTELFSLADAADLGINFDDMKAYLQDEYQIVYPEQEDAKTQTYTAIVYVCLRTDLLQSLLNVDVTIAPNTTLEKAVVLILGSILGEEVGEDIQTMFDFAVMNIEKILADNKIPVPDDTDVQNILTMYKILVAKQMGYLADLKVTDFAKADAKTVQAAYAAATIKMTYGVSPSVEDVLAATASEDENAVAVLILRTMIAEKGETWTANETLETLFDRACKLGYFDPQLEFYADVYNYDVNLEYNCDEIWLTPFAYAAEKGNDKLQYVTITINGTPVKSARSYKLAMTDEDVTTATVEVKYDDGKIADEATYIFNIHNGTKQQTSVALPIPDSTVSGGSIDMDLDYYEELLNGNNSTPSGSTGSGIDAGALTATPYDLNDTQSALIAGAATAADTDDDTDAEPAIATSVQTANTTSPDTGLSDMNMALIIGAAAVVVIAGGITAFVLVKRKKEAGR